MTGLMVANEACWERGCACHDSRESPGVELVQKRKPEPVQEEYLLQQALQALTMMRDKFHEDNCPACDHADAAIKALRNQS